MKAIAKLRCPFPAPADTQAVFDLSELTSPYMRNVAYDLDQSAVVWTSVDPIDAGAYDVRAQIEGGAGTAAVYRNAFGDDPATWDAASPLRNAGWWLFEYQLQNEMFARMTMQRRWRFPAGYFRSGAKMPRSRAPIRDRWRPP